MTGLVCAYFGRPDECCECGGFNETGTQFCSHDCAAHCAERGAEQEAAEQERRAREDAFAEACADLRAKGYADEEIDRMLVGMPT